MATTGNNISWTWEGNTELMKKVANLRDLKKQRTFLFIVYSQSATPLVAPYKNALIELNDTRGPRTKDRMYASNRVDGNRIPPGALKMSVGKIRSKGKIPAIYVGPRSSSMRAGKRKYDGYYSQFLVFGTKNMAPRTNLKQTLKSLSGPTKSRISRKLREKIEAEWRK